MKTQFQSIKVKKPTTLAEAKRLIRRELTDGQQWNDAEINCYLKEFGLTVETMKDWTKEETDKVFEDMVKFKMIVLED